MAGRKKTSVPLILDGAPVRPRERPSPRTEGRPKMLRDPKGLHPGQARPNVRQPPRPEFNDGRVTDPPMFSDAWWDLANPAPIPEGEPRCAKPPPPGYRYRMDGVLVPIIEVRLRLDEPEGQALFLEVLQYTGSQRAAMDAVGIVSRQTVEKHLKASPDFAERYECAVNRHRDAIYMAAYERSVHGYLKPIIGGRNKDEIVAHERVYSDSLTALLLKRHYEEFRQADQRGTNVNIGGTTNNHVSLQVAPEVVQKIRAMTREQRAALRSITKPDEHAEMESAVRDDDQARQDAARQLPESVTKDAIDA